MNVDDSTMVLGIETSCDETAAALGVRRGTVKSRTSRALERLRAIVGEEAR